MASCLQQQVFALDAKYNANRVSNSPTFRTLYIRRRSQLLRDTDRSKETWIRYLKVRSQLLQQKYGTSPNNKISDNYRNSLRNASRSSVSSESGFAIATSKKHKSIAESYAFAGVHHIFDQHTSAVTTIKFANNDRSRLCCASVDGTLSICDVANTPAEVIAILKGHNNAVTGFDWSANNDLIVSSSMDSTIKLWNSSNFTCLRTIIDPNNAQILCCIFQQSNDNLIITGNSKGEIAMANVSTGRFLKGSSKLGGNILSLASDASGTLLWAGNDKGEIVSLRCEISGNILQKRKLYIGTQSSITSINYRAWVSRRARDPTLLINCSNNSIILFSIDNFTGQLKLKRRFQNSHQKHLIKSTFCPIMSFREGSCIVSGSEDSNVYFLDIEKHNNKALINKLQGHASPVLGVSFNYNESLLATSDLEGLVIIWKRANNS